MLNIYLITIIKIVNYVHVKSDPRKFIGNFKSVIKLKLFIDIKFIDLSFFKPETELQIKDIFLKIFF